MGNYLGDRINIKRDRFIDYQTAIFLRNIDRTSLETTS